MQIKPEFNLNQQFPTQAYFIKSAQRSESVYAHIIQLLNKGVRPSEICVLSRRKSVLFDLAKESKKYGVAVQVQVADGFSDKREILDLIFFLKFLVNPYNSENLIGLLRSPWFSITDEEIIQIRQSQSGQSISFWNQLKKFNIELYDLLSNYIQIYSTKGALAAIEQFLKQTLILVASDYIDESSKREANIWKFYTELSEQSKWPHFSLNDFLSGQFKQLQSDLGSGDGEAVPIISPDRVNFMTIHGSKGLQFQHVIIVGLKENAQTTLGSLVTYDGESKSFCVSILSLENSKRLQTDWSYQIRKKFNQRELEEHDRLLYVAMTRAVRSLALVATETKGHDAHSWFKKINWSIDQFTSSDYKVEFIDEVTLQELGMTRSRDKSLDLVDPLNLSHQSIKQAAVTDLISQSEQFSNKSGQNLHEKLVQDFVKAEKGTDLHRYFESLKYNMVVQNLSLSESETAALQWLQNNSQINLNEILQQGHVEWGFGLRDKDRFIQGQIDAWGVVDNTVFILDYKTGSSSYVDKAIKQLMFYGCCLKKMNLINGTQNVKLVAIYPFEKKVETKSVQFDELEFELI